MAHAIKKLYVKYHRHPGGGYHPLSFIAYNICICEIKIERFMGDTFALEGIVPHV